MTAVLEKETQRMGKVFVVAKVENFSDLQEVRKGKRLPSEVRSIETKAMVDTGATALCLPPDLIRQLDILPIKKQKVKTGSGITTVTVYEPVQLTIMGRDCRIEVYALPDEIVPLLGYIPLELLDLLVDPKKGRLIPNPENGDELILDLLFTQGNK